MKKFIKNWLKELEEKNIHHSSFSTKWISCKNDFAETQKNRSDYFENDDLINKFEKTFRKIYKLQEQANSKVSEDKRWA